MTEAGEGPTAIWKGCAYLLRTEGNRELIAAIEGGIKKEVSVGCAVERSVCSICGEEFHTCPHEKGRSTAAGAAGPSWWGPPTPMSGPSWQCPPRETRG
ncbi:MAG: hypothetical protein ACLRWQ_20920 [Flavonifractor plautii]